MIQILASIAVSLLLIAPAISVPVHLSHGDNLQVRNDDMEARDPGWGNWVNDVKKYAAPAAKIASFVIRDDLSESGHSARDIEYLEDLTARDPGWGNWVNDVKKFAGPAAKIASFVIRDGEGAEAVALSARDLEDLEDLAARDPSFGSWFRKVKKFATSSGFKKAASVASLVLREDGKDFDGFERDMVDGMELDELD